MSEKKAEIEIKTSAVAENSLKGKQEEGKERGGRNLTENSKKRKKAESFIYS